MNRRLTATLLGMLLAFSAPLALAKKGGANPGGTSPQHMSTQGKTNANSPTVGQEKGMMRADERKSAQGQMHDQPGKDTKAKKENKGKSKGHDK